MLRESSSHSRPLLTPLLPAVSFRVPVRLRSGKPNSAMRPAKLSNSGRKSGICNALFGNFKAHLESYVAAVR